MIEDEQVLGEVAEEERRQAISELEKQLAEATAELEEKIDDPEGDKPIFAIIPYQGTNGTHRRPIYLECTAEGVVIQPEGVRVSLKDLEPPYGPGNPLDAAIRRARAEFPPSNGAVTSTAYPLLVVRPSGIESYSMARAALSGWDDQFGYELISENLELAFPASVPGMKAKLTQAIELARERQAALVMAMPNQYRQASLGNFPPSQRSAGGASDGLWPGEGNAQGNSRGDAGAGRGLRDMGSDGRSREPGSGARGGYALNGEALPGDLAAGDRMGEQGTSANGASSGLPGSLGFASNFGQAAAAAGAGNNSLAEGTSTTGGSWGPNRAGDDGSQFGAPSDASGMGESRFMSQNGNSGGTARGGSTPHGSAGQAMANGQSAGNAESASSSGAMSAASGAIAAGQFQMPTSFGMNGGPNESGDSSSNQNSQSSSSSSRPSSGSGQSSQQASDSQSSEAAGFAPQLTFTNDRREAAQPIAKTRGRDWAWSEGPRSQTPVVRSIRVQCLEDRWLVLPDSGNSARAVEISFDLSPQERAEQLAIAVQSRVESWGLALTGGYWKPVLSVQVAPNAEWRYTQLKRLLEGSGLEVQLRDR